MDKAKRFQLVYIIKILKVKGFSSQLGDKIHTQTDKLEVNIFLILKDYRHLL